MLGRDFKVLRYARKKVRLGGAALKKKKPRDGRGCGGGKKRKTTFAEVVRSNLAKRITGWRPVSKGSERWRFGGGESLEERRPGPGAEKGKTY